jgi:hypothetical protein
MILIFFFFLLGKMIINILISRFTNDAHSGFHCVGLSGEVACEQIYILYLFVFCICILYLLTLTP